MDRYCATGRIGFDGNDYGVGDPLPFTDGDEELVEQLLELGRIEPAPEAAILKAMSAKQLLDLAKAENVEVPAEVKKSVAIAALITTARAERAAAAIAGNTDGRQANR